MTPEESLEVHSSMIGRARELREAKSYLADGFDVDIVGRPGVGRTTFLRALAEVLREDHWQVVMITGGAGGEEAPLLPLQIAGVLESNPQKSEGLAAAVNALASRARGQRLVVLVDDGANLSNLAWGILAGARALQPFRIVATRLHWEHYASFGKAAESLLSLTLSVELASLSFPETVDVIQRKINGVISARTASRVFAKSAGIPGLALAFIAVAREAGTLVKQGDVWRITGDLWGPALGGAVDSMLQFLEPEDLAALQKLALAGLVSSESGLELVGLEALQRLESFGFVRAHQFGPHEWLSVVPPLIAESFRHDLQAYKSRHLAQGFEVVPESGAKPVAASELLPQSEAALFLLIREKKRSVYIEARKQWLAEPTQEAALALLDALNESRGAKHEIDEVFDAAVQLEHVGETGVKLRIWQAKWHAYENGNLARAYELLDLADEHSPEFAGLVLAARLRIAIDLDNLEEAAAALPPLVHELPQHEAVLPIVHELFFHLGDTVRANLIVERHGEQWPELELRLAKVRTDLSAGLLSQALELAARIFADAIGALDAVAARRAGWLFATICIMQGRYRELVQLHGTIAGLGQVPWFPNIETDDILDVYAVALIRTGKYDEALQLQTNERAGLSARGYLERTARVFVATQHMHSEGRHEDAFEAFWANGIEHINRGSRFLGTLALLNAADFSDAFDHLDDLQGYVEQSESQYLNLYLAYLLARKRGNPEELLAIVDQMLPEMMSTQIVSAFRSAINGTSDAGDPEETSAVEGLFESFLERASSDGFDIDVIEFLGPRLTSREMEIAQLVVAGLSNPQIAESLVISVRTVGNHIHRIMRKTNAKSRDQLVRYLTRSGG
ncbi:hypothetical protein ICM05_10345 [Leucobacter sp. cx-42]|uniref:LuxR C-terminal-related transcriptional regulator n=1 Tax=unclassified Leucobacter TaxID=2621730 RepID=UPI00165E0CB8|nr:MULTISPECIES: LuxR C-terminal-related transcriptional regulator [unclassified Leucobacter]MBC9955031.1 hypothetical protein [Leucobacter sp. cx-42]